MTVQRVEAPTHTEALVRTEVLPRFDTLLLALLAAATLAVVRIEMAWHRGTAATWVVVEILTVVGLWLLMRKHTGIRQHVQKYVLAYLLGTMGVLVAGTCVGRFLGRVSVPFEISLLLGVQFAAMVLALFSHVRRLSGASVLLSAFLLLFSMTMTGNRVVFLLAGAYGVAGLWWLMVAYWERIQVAFAASHVEQCVPVRSAVVGASGLVVLVLTAILGTSSASTYVLSGFLPTSGGDRWSDPNARAGVEDGDALVAAQDEARSFGPVESDLFLDSEMPSLYDMFDETYGEPPRPKNKQQKAIALDAQTRTDNDQRVAKSQRSGREFSAVRRQKRQSRQQLEDRKSPAMLYLIGKTPLHLGMESYDFFDGRMWEHREGWREAKDPEVRSRLGKPWAVIRDWYSLIHRGTNCYGLKVINLKTSRIPSPPQLVELQIDKVDRSDFFAWTRDGMIHMPGQEHIPQLTVIHMHARQANLHALRQRSDFSAEFAAEDAARLAPYLQTSVDRRELAEAWTAGVPRGWLQVDAIVDRLRNRFQHAPEVTAPESCRDVIGHFLEIGTGPDYMFASTAVELLRTLGYPARLVSGFYARPERFDHRAGQTTVLASDVHVWAEVCIDGRTWVTIEPTPGYRPPTEELTFQEWATALAWKCVRWCRWHLVEIACTVLGMVLVVVFRRACMDLVGWLVCSLLGLGSAEARLIWTIRLLEWRAWLVGRPRSPDQTLTSWYGQLIELAPDERRPAIASFFHWADRLLYSQRAIDTINAQDIRRACAAIVSTCERKFISNSLPTSAR